MIEARPQTVDNVKDDAASHDGWVFDSRRFDQDIAGLRVFIDDGSINVFAPEIVLPGMVISEVLLGSPE
jgi:hypothetical protein